MILNFSLVLNERYIFLTDINVVHKDTNKDVMIERKRQAVINNAVERFNWSREECEEIFGKDTSTFLSRVNLVDNKEED